MYQSIKNTVEAEAGCGGGDDAVGAGAGGEDFADVVGAEAVATDGVEGPGKTANHPVEVAAALGGHGEVAPFLNEIEAVNGFDGVGVTILAVGCTKGGEIVGADQNLSGLSHRGQVEGDIAAGPEVALLERVGAAQIKAVNVTFADGGVAGVKGFRHGGCGTDLNRLREDRMEGANELAGIMGPCGVEMETLPAGVDSGIGTAAAVGFDGSVKDLPQGVFKDILNTVALGLALPAVEFGAVVGADAFPAHVRMLAKGAGDARLCCRDGAQIDT